MKKLLLLFCCTLILFSVIYAKQKPVNFQAAYPTTSLEGKQDVQSPLFHPTFYESFEENLPLNGWLSVSYGTAAQTWNITSTKSRTGIYSAIVVFGPASLTMNEWLISPAIDLSQSVGATLRFYEDQDYWTGYGDHHYVKISTTSRTDTTTFTTLMDMTPLNHEINGFAGAPVEIDLSNYVGEATVYLAFVYTGSDADNWYLDDIAIYEPDDHDLSIAELHLTQHLTPDTTFQPTATVKNVGLNSESFSVSFGYYDWQGFPVVVDTKNIDTLGVGASQLVMFENFTFEANKQYTYFAEINSAMDMDSTNNFVTKIVDTFTKQKSTLLIEKGTGTWCQYCPGSANAVDRLFEEHADSLVIFEYHYDDDYQFSDGLSRIIFYGITGYPTAVFNGTGVIVGGSTIYADWTPLYNIYVDQFLYEFTKRTPFSLDLQIAVTGSKVNAITNTTFDGVSYSYPNSFRIFYGLNESHIAVPWQGMDTLQFVARTLAPSEDGSVLHDGDAPVAVGSVISDTVTFRIPGVVEKENCEVIAFIQNMETKEVMAAAKVPLVQQPSSVEETSNLTQPTRFAVLQNYPNPFNPDTWIQFELPEQGEIDLAIYNVQGQRIRSLATGSYQKGWHKILWDGKNDFGAESASGIYFIKAKFGDQLQYKKLVKMK